MKKRFTLFLMMLFSFAAYQISAQSEYQQARFNTAEERNFYKISGNVQKALAIEKLKAVTPSEKNQLKRKLNNLVDGNITGKIL